jgi:hypothetical protein
MHSIRSNVDLFNYLRTDAPQSFRSLVKADGVELRSHGLFRNLRNSGLSGWLVEVTRKHGSKRYIAVLIGHQGYLCQSCASNTPVGTWLGDPNGPPNLTNGTKDV